MDILPQSLWQFRQKGYWNAFFRKLRGQAFEWYCEYSDIESLLAKALELRTADVAAEGRDMKFLNLGNGESKLPVEIYQHLGYKQITSIDFSHEAMEKMSRLYPKKQFPELEWKTCDVRESGLLRSFSHESFDIVLDKAFLDSYLSLSVEELNNQRKQHEDTCNSEALAGSAFDIDIEAEKLFSSVFSVLKSGGLYILVSLCQPYILKTLTKFLLTQMYKKRDPRIGSIKSVNIAPFTTMKKDQTTVSRFEPFFICIEKGPPIVPLKSLQFTLFHDSHDFVFGTKDDNKDSILERWPIAQLPNVVYKWTADNEYKSIVNKEYSQFQAGVSRQLQLISRVTGDSTAGRHLYSLVIYDSTSTKPNIQSRKTACLLVPPWQERHWIFHASEGIQKLAEQCQVNRLLLLFLGPENEATRITGDQCKAVFESAGNSLALSKLIFDGIKKEIAPTVAMLSLSNEVSTPIITAVDEIENRIEVLVADSRMADKIYVYDYPLANEEPLGRSFLRAMVFQCNPWMRQSEVKVVRDPCNTSSIGTSYDFSVIKSDCYLCMLCSLALLPGARFGKNQEMEKIDGSCLNICVLGLGGGVLVNILHSLLPTLCERSLVTGVELDDAVLSVARRFFGFPQVNSTSVEVHRVEAVIDDALHFVKHAEPKFYDILFLDITYWDVAADLTGPPPEFLENDFLTGSRRLLRDGGLLVCNIVARSEATRCGAFQRLQSVYNFVVDLRVPEMLNRILICSESRPEDFLDFSSSIQLLASRGMMNTIFTKASGDDLCSRATLLPPLVAKQSLASEE